MRTERVNELKESMKSFRNIFTSKYTSYIGGAVATFAVVFLTAAVTTTTIRKGGF